MGSYIIVTAYLTHTKNPSISRLSDVPRLYDLAPWPWESIATTMMGNEVDDSAP